MRSMAPQGDAQADMPMNRLLALAKAQPGLTALLLMSVVGLGISIYLTITHYNSGVPLVCNTTGLISCQSVTTSAYSVVPGTSIPITIPGMLWFLGLGAAAIVGLRAAATGAAEDPRLRPATLLWTAAGLLFVIYLVFCEIVLVQRICEWCTVIHLLTLASFLIALTRWQRRGEAPALRVAPASARPATRSGSTGARSATSSPARRANRSRR